MDPLLNWLVIDDVPMNDLLDPFGCDFGVPDAIRPNQQNGAFFTDSQAVNFAP